MDTQEKQSKDIVDVNGNAYKSTKDNSVIQFIKDNIRDIGGPGLALRDRFKFCVNIKN